MWYFEYLICFPSCSKVTFKFVLGWPLIIGPKITVWSGICAPFEWRGGSGESKGFLCLNAWRSGTSSFRWEPVKRRTWETRRQSERWTETGDHPKMLRSWRLWPSPSSLVIIGIGASRNRGAAAISSSRLSRIFHPTLESSSVDALRHLDVDVVVSEY